LSNETLVAGRSKPIRETEEIFLINGVEHRNNCALDDFLFQRRNPKRSPFFVIFMTIVSKGSDQIPVSGGAYFAAFTVPAPRCALERTLRKA